MLLFDEQTQSSYAYTPEPAADLILWILVAMFYCQHGISQSQTRISGFTVIGYGRGGERID